MKRVVITGLGALTPLGNNVQAFVNNLWKGTSGAAPITRFNAERFRTKFACELKDYDVKPLLDKKEIKNSDLFTQYALVAADEAIKDSGLDFSTR